MRHTFVIHLTTETGDVDPEELMAEVEAFVIEALHGLDLDGIGQHARPARPEVECVDAWEAGEVGDSIIDVLDAEWAEVER